MLFVVPEAMNIDDQYMFAENVPANIYEVQYIMTISDQANMDRSSKPVHVSISLTSPFTGVKL